MLRVVTGPFHPDLEDALVERVARAKTRDPLTPLALVVPSSRVLQRLRERLVLEEGRSLLNVSFLTFHQLALRLYQEHLVETGDAPLEIVEDFVFRQLLAAVSGGLSKRQPARGFGDLPAGGWTALWATIRDLKDSAVDPDLALRGVAEGVFDTEDGHRLSHLFTLYAQVLAHSRKLGLGSPDDLAAVVTPWVQKSPFLSRLEGLYYYGFYDLTQVQLTLFQAISASAEMTLFYPLCDDPAFGFARRFFDRYIQSMVRSRSDITVAVGRATASGQGNLFSPPMAEVRVMTAVGAEDELTLVCKEVLSLVETHGYQFSEIGVVARSLDGYGPALRRTFLQHRIPFTSTIGVPVMEDPAVKVLVRLAILPLTGFACAPMLDVLSSPLYRVPPDAGVEPRPDLWQSAASLLGIRRGEGDWRRLDPTTHVSLGAENGAELGDQQSEPLPIPAAQLRLLWRLVSTILQDCRTLPERGSVAALTEAFCRLAAAHLKLDDLEAAFPDLLVGILAQLGRVGRIVSEVAWKEWVALFSSALDETMVPLAAEDHPGVQVLDAMAARGLPFRALFVIGLNEKVFPRFIREDAFLRDRHRRALDETLGYKIDEKLAAYDEERLLFALLRQAARTRLYLLCQRADTDGRPLAPSPYLDGIREIAAETFHLPRRLSDRKPLFLFAPELLTREDLALRLVLDGADPCPVLAAIDRCPDLFAQGAEALRAIEGPGRQIGPYDGMIGRLESVTARLTAKGVAPTTLESYARCPFKFFSRHVLRLDVWRTPSSDELSARAHGDLAHRLLREVYVRLLRQGWPRERLAPAVVEDVVRSVAAAVFGRHASRYATGYPLLWTMAQETIVELVRAVILEDEEEYHRTGYRPMACEVDAEGTLDVLGADYASIKVRGRLDRIDVRTSPPGLRIIDYKFRHGPAMKAKDRDLMTAAIRGQTLQPPLYTLMNVGDRRPDAVQFRFLAPRWEAGPRLTEFDAAVWPAPAGERLKRGLRMLVDGLQAGHYFLVPEEDCDACDVATACRRLHGPSWWRAYAAAPAKALRSLRKEKPAGA